MCHVMRSVIRGQNLCSGVALWCLSFLTAFLELGVFGDAIPTSLCN